MSFFSLLLPGSGAARAQELPLTGPLIALNTAAGDGLVLYDLGTQTYRTLSAGPGWHTVWGFAPDGCRLLLTLSDGALPAHLYTLRLDGRDLRPLIEYDRQPLSEWGVWEPQWSPDGRRIAFVWLRNDGDELLRHIAWVPADGGTPALYSASGREAAPRWSPDGTRLVYLSYEDRAAGADVFATAIPTAPPLPGQVAQPVVLLTEADLWLVNADGSGKMPLTGFLTGSVSRPAWSPDGLLVSFVFAQSPNNDMVWMIGAQPGARPTQLSTTWSRVLDVTWLPDSTAILSALRDFGGMAENRLWQIPLVGRAEEGATRYLDALDLISADYPRFSPDGRWLVLRTAYEVALVDVAAGTVQRLEARTMGNTPPVWSPAGFAGEAACP
jgi:Tol biopolymer transport system component